MVGTTGESTEGQYGECPQCGRSLGPTDLDTEMCACGACFEIDGEKLLFEGGEAVHVGQ